MNNSQENLIELVDLKSPPKTKAKPSNKVDLSPLNSATYSISSASEEAIVNIFSVAHHTKSSKRRNDDTNSATHTISEISDDVFIVKNEVSSARSRTYREKISEHIKKIKDKASTPSQDILRYKGKIPVEKIRRESENVDAEVESTRNKFNLNVTSSFQQEKDQFFKFTKEQASEVLETSEHLQYMLPDQVTFNIALSEKELFFIPTRKLIDVNKKNGPIEPTSWVVPKIPSYELNLLEQRLLTIEDLKWFSSDGNLYILEDPIAYESYRPVFLYRDFLWTSYKPASLQYDNECEEVIVIEDKILDVHISQLKFSFHPLFSLEHVFAEKLQNLWNYYISVEKDDIGKLLNELESLRLQRKHSEDPDIDKEIKIIREKLFTESQKQRELNKTILITWKNLKQIREKQKYSNTSIKLMIKKENVDFSKDSEQYDKFFENTFEELVREEMAKLKKHKENLLEKNGSISDNSSDNSEKIIQRKKDRKEIEDKDKSNNFEPAKKVKHTTDKNSGMSGSKNDLQEESSKIKESSSQNEIKKIDNSYESEPTKNSEENHNHDGDKQEQNSYKSVRNASDKYKNSKKIEEDTNEEDELSSSMSLKSAKVKQDLIKRFKKSFRPPGEPVLKFYISDTNSVDQEIKFAKESARRTVANSTKFYLKILCNNVEACKTRSLYLKDDFSLDVNETFSLQLSNIPKFLTVLIVEQPKALQKKKICELNVAIPNGNVKTNLEKKFFEKSDLIHYKHEGLGSGIDLKSVAEKLNIKVLNRDNYHLKTTGYLEYSMEWEKKVKAKPTENIDLESKIDVLNDFVGKHFEINKLKLKEVLEKHAEEFDGSDQDLSVLEADEGFRLNNFNSSLNFCNIVEIEENIRLKILRLRDEKEIEFDGILVPNRIKEIPFNILSDYKRRKVVEEKGYFPDESDEYDDEFEMQRNYGKKYLKQLYIRVFQKCKSIENNLDYESVVDERILFYFQMMVKTLLRNFWNWFRWQPKISKPLPTLSKKAIKESENKFKMTENIHIMVKIICAKNIPIRMECTSQNNESTEDEVRSFVRVDYKNVSVRTEVSKGTNPVWNEVLEVYLESTLTDYLNPYSLEGSISINLFDESKLEIKKLNDKKCANWLGGLDVPLSAICSGDSLKGFFKLKLPNVLLGYETEAEKSRTKSPKINIIQTHQSFLQMEITIHPNVPKLTPDMEELPPGDIPYIQEHILAWNNSYNKSFPARKFSALAIDANAKTTCVTRYIRPLEPPQINSDEFDVTSEQCLKYISLIPFTNYNNFYDNVWLSTEQLLRLMIGSVTDHAVALTCYLQALKKEAWLLLGYGIPHGSTAYVFVKEYATDTGLPIFSIYDVVCVEKYNILDEHCPLQRIYCVINGENVWANTQNHDNLPLTRFDFNRRSDWLSLFNNEISAPVNFVSNKVIYRDKQEIQDLEAHLERQIKKQISKLRQLDKTIWNSHLSKKLKNILRTLELNSIYNRNHIETISELNAILSAYHAAGFAANLPFTSVSHITKKIKQLGFHIQEETRNEFVVSVYINCYAGNVLSIWIFLAIIYQNLPNETVL